MKGIERERVAGLPLWGWAAVASLLLWALYVFTLAPTTGWWDTSEYIATAHILGIPHPPGNPLFVVLGRVWDVLLSWTGLPVAVRINLLSATMSAGAAFFWFLAVARIWAHFTEDRRQLLVAAFAAVIVGGTAYTVWSQSNINEKVYTVSLFAVALVTYLAMLWEDETGTRRGDRIFLLMAFLLGLGAANHTMSLLPLPALGLFLLWHHWRTLLRWRLVSAAVLVAAVGFSVQVFFVPIRSAQDPIIDEANPECESLVRAAVTPLEILPVVGTVWPDAWACEPLRASLAREQYAKPPLGERQAPIAAQYANWWQYFDWQWARSLEPPARAGATMVFLFLGLVGLWRHGTGDRDSFVYFVTLLATVTVVLVFYLNFRYGYSLYPEIPDELHEVRERDYFYLIGFNLWGVYAGMGIVALWRLLAERLAEGSPAEEEGTEGRRPWGRGRLAAAPLLGLALLPLLLNFSYAERRGDFAARDWAYNLLQSVEPYGVLFTNGDNDTFPLWYLQEVEGIRQDVTVMVYSYLGTRWYPKQLRELTQPCPEGVDPTRRTTVIVCQRPWEPEEAVGPYRGTDPRPPAGPAITYSDEEIEGLPPYYQPLPQDTAVRISEWITGRLRAGQVITFPDIMVLHIVRTALGDRPVYVATTAPPVYASWNLQPHLLRQGLGLKLVNGPLEATTDTVNLSQTLDVPWVDLDRTRTLLWDVFQIAYLEDWERWPEPSTRLSIPTQYWLAYMALGLAEEQREMQEEARRSFVRAAWLDELRMAGGS